MSSQSAPATPWSFRIATIAGIPVRIHVTFLLLIVYIIAVAQNPQGRPLAILLPFVFLSVILHEFGHALTAKHYGIGTKDITLYPIGGMAVLTGRPKPHQEFWIALAGPLVNVGILVVVGAVIFAMRGQLPNVLSPLHEQSLLEGIFTVNVILPLFNMIPAFPMDGGRVLRALLAMKLPETTATQIAGVIGQIIAVLFGMIGILYGMIVLVLIAVFVFLGAGQEVQSAIGLSLLAGKRVGDAMMTDFRIISGGQTLEEISQFLLAGAQQDFPVAYGDEVYGVLTRDGLMRGLAQHGGHEYVAGHMRRDFPQLSPFEPLEAALTVFSQGDRGPILVMDNGRLAGILTMENLYEFMLLQQARGRG